MMDHNEMRAILHRLKWSQGELAERAQRNTGRIHKQARGRDPIDAALANWLRAVDRAWPHDLLNSPPTLRLDERQMDAVHDLLA
jgi:hypothetical protein